MATEIVLGVAEEGSDELRLEELSLQLRNELLDLDDVTSVKQLAAGEVPEGARAGLALAVGGLVTTLAQGNIVGLVQTVVAWLRRGGSERSVRIEVDGDVLDLKGVSDETQRKLVDDWLSRHARPA